MVISNQLAIHGGSPIFPQGPPAWPPHDDDIRLALEAALADGSWGRYHGPHVRRLEALLAEMHDVPHALTCCSGTIAVELALRGLKIGPGDEVVLAAYDYRGNFRCIEAVGALPVLVDIDPQTWCLDAARVADAIGPATRAVLVSHLHGGQADMRTLDRVATEHGIRIVEDACQAPGAVVQGRPAGTWGDVGVFSFGGSKLLTAGRGGALITPHADVYHRLKLHCERASNHAYPLSEMQAATLVPQLRRLAERNATRQARVRRLLDNWDFSTTLAPVALPSAGGLASYYKLAFHFVPQECGGWTRQQFIHAIQGEGVAMDVGFPGFLQRSSRRCRRHASLSAAAEAAEATILLHHPILLEAEESTDRVAVALEKVVEAAIAR